MPSTRDKKRDYNEKPHIERTYYCVDFNDDGAVKTSLPLEAAIASLSKVSGHLDVTIPLLKSVYEPPHVVFKADFKRDYTDWTTGKPFVHASGNYRFVFTEDDPPLAKFILRLKGTHLVVNGVAIQTVPSWSEFPPNMNSTLVHCPDPAMILHDIGVDITLFYSCSPLSYMFEGVHGGKALSYLKLKYAMLRGLASVYGAPHNLGNLFCISSVVRNNLTADVPFTLSQVQTLTALWDEFIDWLYKDPALARDATPFGAFTIGDFVKAFRIANKTIPDLAYMTPITHLDKKIFDHITSKNPRKKDLCRRTLLQEIAKLDNGTYMLITTGDRPTRLSDQDAVALLLGGKSWNFGLYKICKFSRGQTILRRHYPHVDGHRFIVSR